MEPKTLSTSKILCSAVRLKVLRIVSFSCKRMLESKSSSSPAACRGTLNCGNSSMASEHVRTNVRNLCFNMAISKSLMFKLVQLLYSPVNPLFYGGVELGVFLESFELGYGAFIMQIH